MSGALGLYSKKEAAEALSVSEDVLDGLIRGGKLPIVRFSRRVFIRREDLERLVLESVTTKADSSR